MTANSNINTNNVDSLLSPKKLNYLAFLKFVAMALIIFWHVVTIVDKPFDIGARMCEFLIVASGFLVGYNHYKKPMPCTFKQSLKYTYRRFRQFYPIHILCLVLIIFLNFTNYKESFNITLGESFLANIFLVQAWSPNSTVVFSFNGISWFLSAILFCYLFVPLLLKGIKNVKISLISLAIVIIFRVLIELFVKLGSGNIYGIWFHANPFIKLLEFSIGMFVVPTFFFVKNKINFLSEKIIFKVFFTIIELGIPLGMYFFMAYLPHDTMRVIFVLFSSAVVFISSLDGGYIAKFFSLKVPSRILTYQLEAFMLHLVVNELLKKPMRWFGINYPDNIYIQFLIIFVFVVGFAAIYHEFLTKKLAKVIDFLTIKIYKFLTK